MKSFCRKEKTPKYPKQLGPCMAHYNSACLEHLLLIVLYLILYYLYIVIAAVLLQLHDPKFHQTPFLPLFKKLSSRDKIQVLTSLCIL